MNDENARHPGGEHDYGSAGHPGRMSGDFADLRDEAARHGAAAYKEVKARARSIGGAAQEQASRYATTQKELVSEHLDEFAQAIRRAGDELSQRDSTLAAQLVRQAAGGLESMSRSVSGANLSDIVGSVRAFGRANPAAFIGGAVLAGFALGRFARASARHDDETWEAGSWEEAAERERWQSGSANEGSPLAPTSGFADAPAAQGYGGGGMGADPIQSATPSSATDPSITTSSYSRGGEPGAISTGETS
jgi:hypothetical protein